MTNENNIEKIIEDKLYEEWCGRDRYTDSCINLYDSTQAIEFAMYCYKELAKERKALAKKAFNAGVKYASDAMKNKVNQSFDEWYNSKVQ